MSIKYLNPKSYGQVYQKLVNGYRKVKGKDPTGLDLIKIKLEAAEQIRNSEKIIKFPEEKITPFYEERPSKGPQADVKKFPTKNKPAAQTYSSDFLDLLEEFNKISKNQPSLAEITGVSNKYPEKTGIVKSTIELLESKDPKSLSRELQKIMKREGTYVDYSDEEVAQILNGFESRTKNKIKPAEEMIDEGDFDPSGFAGGGLAYMLGEPVRMFKGGRIGYSVGAGKKGVQGLLDLVKNKFGKKSITTADKIARPESAVTRDMFKQFNERMKQKDLQKEYKQGDPITSENFGNTPFAPDTTDLKKAREMKRQLTDDEIEDYEEILGDSETWMNEGTVEEAEAAVKRRKEYEQQMYSEYKVEKQARKELEQAYKEIDFRMTGEDTKYEANELADMLAETRYKTEMSDLPQKTQIDLYGEAYDYLMEVKRDAANFKGATNIKTGKNIVTGEQELPLDPLTGKPRKLNAEGGRIGYSGGGIVKFLNKVLGKQHLSEIKKTDPQLYKGLLEVAPLFKKRDKEALIKYMQKYLPERSADEIEELVTGPNDKMYGQLIRLGSGRDYKGKQELFKKIDQKEMLENLDVKGRKANATGGRIGFSVGGIDKVRRAFLKLLGAGAGATAATKTGLFGLLKGKQEAKIATKAAEQVVKRNEPPAYVFDLVEIIRAKGKDITKSAQTIERETVKTYKGVDLYETPDGFRIRAEGKSAQEGGKEIDLMYSQMDEIKDEGLETQKSFTVTDYEEATVRPDAEGKMKDVDFYVDEADHKELKKIVDEEKNKFKSGGLAYMLGE
jgi:hypothetical protein